MIAIHAGLKKCGSSSLHHFLRMNRKLLKGCSIDCSPWQGVARNIADETMERRTFDPRRGTLLELRDYWRANGEAKVLVLSSEMWENAETRHIETLKRAFLAARPDETFRVILIIRNLADLIVSVYAQKVRTFRESEDFDRFFETIVAERRTDYFDTARRWAEVFGWENLRVRVLDRRHLVNGDLIDDFLSLLDCGAERLLGGVSRPGIMNPAPGWRTVESLRALANGSHGLAPEHPLIRAFARHANRRLLARCAVSEVCLAHWSGEKGDYLTRAQFEQCNDLYSRAVEQMNARLPCRVPRPQPPSDWEPRRFLPEPAFVPQGERNAFYDLLWAAFKPMKQARKAA